MWQREKVLFFHLENAHNGRCVCAEAKPKVEARSFNNQLHFIYNLRKVSNICESWKCLPLLVSSLGSMWTWCTSPLRQLSPWPLCWGMCWWWWWYVWTGLYATPPFVSSCLWQWQTLLWGFWSSLWLLSSVWDLPFSSTLASSSPACCWLSPRAPSFPCSLLPLTDICESRFPPGEELL